MKLCKRLVPCKGEKTKGVLPATKLKDAKILKFKRKAEFLKSNNHALFSLCLAETQHGIFCTCYLDHMQNLWSSQFNLCLVPVHQLTIQI